MLLPLLPVTSCCIVLSYTEQCNHFYPVFRDTKCLHSFVYALVYGSVSVQSRRATQTLPWFDFSLSAQKCHGLNFNLCFPVCANIPNNEKT